MQNGTNFGPLPLAAKAGEAQVWYAEDHKRGKTAETNQLPVLALVGF